MVMVYIPGETCAKTNRPAWSVVAFTVNFRFCSVAITAAPGIGLFCGSSTFPEMFPLTDCAHATDRNNQAKNQC